MAIPKVRTSKYSCVISGRSVGVGVWGGPWLLREKDWVELLSSQTFNQHCFEPLMNDSRALGKGWCHLYVWTLLE